MSRLVALGMLATLSVCGPIAPREIGPTKKGTGPPAGEVLDALRGKDAARLVTTERAHSPGAHLVFVDEDGRRTRDLTGAPETLSVDMTPAWSPDGRWIVFASSRGRRDPQKTSLWVAGMASETPEHPLLAAKGDSVDLAPAWSPDGKRLVFASTRGGELDLWIAEVAVKDGDLVVSRVTQATRTAELEFLPMWSPRGDLIAFTEVAGERQRIVVMAPDGSRRRALTEGPRDSSPVFSGDGARVFFSRPVPDRGDLDLFVVGLAGGEPAHFIDDPIGDETGARLSADGRFVLCTSTVRREGGVATYSMLLVAEVRQAAAGWRALQDRYPTSRIGVAVAPVPLDAARLARAPRYDEAVAAALRALEPSP